MINFNALKELKVKIGRLFTFSSTNNKKLKNSKSPNYGTQNVADTININNKPDDNEELPYVYIQGSFGGNGHVLDFRSCTTYNLSDKFVFIDKIEVLGATIPFENALIKSGESLQHTGINGLAYPSSDDPDQCVQIYFHSRNKEEFISRHGLKFEERQDGKFNIVGLEEPVIKKVAK